jgi:hypothetical protein
VFGSAVADGNIIEDPYEDIDNFIADELFSGGLIPTDVGPGGLSGKPAEIPLSWSIENGGRMLLCGRQGGRLDLLPLFSDDGASGTIQMWGFDWINTQRLPTSGNDGDASKYVVYPVPTDRSVALGMAYPVPRDDDLEPQTHDVAVVTAGSGESRETQQLKFTSEIPYPSPFGDVFTVGPRQIYNISGFYGIFVWVPTLTAGELVILARTV